MKNQYNEKNINGKIDDLWPYRSSFFAITDFLKANFSTFNVLSNVISTKNQQLEMIDRMISTKYSWRRAKCSSFLGIRRLYLYPLVIISFLLRLNRLDKNPGEIRRRQLVSGNLDISHDLEKY